MGRPTKLTPELQAQLVSIIEAGNYRSVACKAVGLHPDTFRKWMQKSRRPYIGFRRAVEAAEARGEVEVVGLIRQQVSQNYRAGLELLARKYPQRWATKSFSGDLDENGHPTNHERVRPVLVVPSTIDDIHEWSRRAKDRIEANNRAMDAQTAEIERRWDTYRREMEPHLREEIRKKLALEDSELRKR
jgi:hypothetical protein